MRHFEEEREKSSKTTFPGGGRIPSSDTPSHGGRQSEATVAGGRESFSMTRLQFKSKKQSEKQREREKETEVRFPTTDH